MQSQYIKKSGIKYQMIGQKKKYLIIMKIIKNTFLQYFNSYAN